MAADLENVADSHAPLGAHVRLFLVVLLVRDDQGQPPRLDDAVARENEIPLLCTSWDKVDRVVLSGGWGDDADGDKPPIGRSKGCELQPENVEAKKEMMVRATTTDTRTVFLWPKTTAEDLRPSDLSNSLSGSPTTCGPRQR